MKKICYVVTIPLTIRAFFIPQLKYLADNGFDVSVICSPDDTLQEELGEKVRFIPVDMPRGLSVTGSIKAIKELSKVFKKEKFDLVQYSTPNAALYASIAAKKVGIKIRNYHLMGFRYLGAGKLGQVILKAMEKFTCKLSTSIECVSNSNLELGVKENIFPLEKAMVVWNGSTGGVDLNRFDINHKQEWRDAVRNEYGISEDIVVFGFVGRVTKDKGIDELLEAYKMIIEKQDNTKLVIIGDFEAEENLNQELLSWSRVCESVTYISSKTDIERYFAAIDILVLPSYREGFGNVVIEAQAMGVPVIVSNIPGPIDAIDNKLAKTVRVKDKDDLYKAMYNFLQDDYAQLGIESHNFVRDNFCSNELSARILNQKRELLDMIGE